MDLKSKAYLVRGLFLELDREIASIKNTMGIDCVEGCAGRCCNREDIYATVLEFLPLAFSLFGFNKVEEVLSRLENRASGVCVFYREEEDGRCLEYNNRGLICRLFGFSSIMKKDRTPQIVTCRFIKERYKNILTSMHSHLFITHYYRRLRAIDIGLTQRDVPINNAISSAINSVGIYISYKLESVSRSK